MFSKEMHTMTNLIVNVIRCKGKLVNINKYYVIIISK